MSGASWRIPVEDRLGVSGSDLTPEARESVEERLQQIIDAWQEFVVEVWPVDTGLSLSSWDAYMDGLDLVFENPVDYAEWVHPAGEDEGASLEAVEARASALFRDAFPTLQRLVAGGLRAGFQGVGARDPRERSSGLFQSLSRAFDRIRGRDRERARSTPRERATFRAR